VRNYKRLGRRKKSLKRLLQHKLAHLRKPQFLGKLPMLHL
jgi:hypothetical protein